ncbi:3195_t:CDS:1, partial [Acaulospora morrowiae]
KIAAPLLAIVVGRLEMMVVLLSDVGSGFDVVTLVSEQQKICLSLVRALVNFQCFSLSLSPWTLSVEIVMRFLRLFVVRNDLVVNFIVEVGEEGVGRGLVGL